MTDTSNDTPPKAAETPSPYPTVQILQAAMAHRESIRHSFESQRATLAEAIAAQRQAMIQAVDDTRQNSASLDTFIQKAQETHPEPGAGAPVDDPAPQTDGAMAPATPTEKLVAALNMLITPGTVAAKTAAAQHAVATQQFLDSIKDMITEEVSRQTGQKPVASSAETKTDTGSSAISDADETPPPDAAGNSDTTSTTEK